MVGGVRLTGHPGERRNRAVALVTDDLRLYHRLVPIFETHSIPLLGLAPGEEVPESVQALLGGPDGDRRSVAIRDDDEATLLAVLTRLDPRPTASRNGYHGVVFGVDPGRTIGLAVVADGQPLLVAEEHDPIGAVRRIARWMTGLHASSSRIHVGDGAHDVGHAIEAAARSILPDTAVTFVRETSTSPRAPVTGSRHADAAVHIAMRRR